jgi:predicted acylesterase/phospholipase RssA
MNVSQIEYLSFEGGGGRGIVYLGAIRALEKKLHRSLNNKTVNDIDPNTEVSSGYHPLFPFTQKIDTRQLKGISGASAGAINAFFLAIGMTSGDINTFLSTQKEMITALPLWRQKEYVKTISYTETFFSDPGNKVRCITEADKQNGFIKSVEIKNSFFKSIGGAALKSFARIASIIKMEGLFEKSNQSTLFNKILSKNARIDTDTTSEYVESVIYQRGALSGAETFAFFEEAMQFYLYQKIQYVISDPVEVAKIIDVNKPPREVTFREFFGITGVDLVFTAVNLSQGKPLYFSVYHTPDMPVIPALICSFSIPILFKPVYVDYNVDKADSSKQAIYKGLFVDGGMLNNFPVHAFDDLIRVKKNDINSSMRADFQSTFFLSGTTPYSAKNLSPKTFGIRCGVDKTVVPKYEDIYPSENKMEIVNFLGQLLETFLYPGEGGQIRNATEARQTVEVPTTYDLKALGLKFEIALEVTDFAHPQIDRVRGATGIAELKDELIRQAYEKVFGILKIFILFSVTFTSCIGRQSSESKNADKVSQSDSIKYDNHNYEIIDHRRNANEPMILVKNNKKYANYDSNGLSVWINVAHHGKKLTPFINTVDSIMFYYSYNSDGYINYKINDSFTVTDFNNLEDAKSLRIWGEESLYSINLYKNQIVSLKILQNYSRIPNDTLLYKNYNDRNEYFYKSNYTKGEDTYFVFCNYNEDGSIKESVELKNIMWTYSQLMNYIKERGYDTLKSNIQLVTYDSYKKKLDTTKLD